VVAKKVTMREGSARLWDWTIKVLDDAVRKGFLAKSS
jgi:hypothetical protein